VVYRPRWEMVGEWIHVVIPELCLENRNNVRLLVWRQTDAVRTVQSVNDKDFVVLIDKSKE